MQRRAKSGETAGIRGASGAPFPATKPTASADTGAGALSWLAITTVLTLAYAAAPAHADADGPSIVVASTPAELQAKFCTADATKEHVFVLPAAMFVDSEELICPVGPYKLYRILEHNDPDDFEYYLDPPFGTTGRLGCDGKGGKTMTWVAVNCRPE